MIARPFKKAQRTFVTHGPRLGHALPDQRFHQPTISSYPLGSDELVILLFKFCGKFFESFIIFLNLSDETQFVNIFVMMLQGLMMV